MQVTQLTGFSDPVYAEAYVHVNQYDIVLDVLVVNQTNDTLQNLTVELATLGQSRCCPADTVMILALCLFEQCSLCSIKSKKNKVSFTSHGAALISVSYSPQPDTSLRCKATNTGLVYRAACLFTPQLLPVPSYTAW